MAHRSAFIVVACALIALFYTPAADAQQNVVWTNVVNATASGNTLQKTSGGDGSEDAGGVSQQSIESGMGDVQFTLGTGQQVYAGLSHSTATPLSYTQLEYAFVVYPNSTCEVRESGLYKTDCTFVGGDVLKIAIEPGPVVKYYRNGALIYTSSSAPANYPYVLGADLFNLGSTVSNARVTTGTLYSWSSIDVGDVGLAGTASINGNILTVQGAGADIGGTLDAFHFVYQTLTGDGQLVTRVDSIQNTNAAAQAGIMFRDGLDPSAAHVTLDIKASGGVEFVQRGAAGAATVLLAETKASVPRWIKLVRTGRTIDVYVSANGSSWSSLGSTVVTMSATLDVGVVVSSHDRTRLNTSTFEGLALEPTTSTPGFYSATTNRNAYPKPSLPRLGRAGSQFSDPTFGSTILRVTDESTRPGSVGRSFTVPSAAHQLAWNATSDLFYLRSIDGTIIPYTFDAKSMKASRIQPQTTGDGGLTISSQVEPQFSFLQWNLLFGSRQDPVNDWPIIRQFDFVTRTYTDLLNLGQVTTTASGTYAGALSSSASVPEKLAVLFGGPSQDSHFKVAVFQSVGGAAANPVVLDSWASTVTSNGTTSTTNIPLGFLLHHAWIDQSGRYVILYTVNQQPVPYYVWDLTTNTFVAVSTNAGGHDATGFGWQINQACCSTTSWDAAQWQRRALSSPETTADVIKPVLTPQEIYLADHTSWNDARPGTLMPILSSLYRYYNGSYNTTPWRAWDDEIVAIDTNAQGASTTVWRFAHHRSDVSYDDDPSKALYFWYVPNAVISPNGQWAIFTSNWEKTLGAAVGSDLQPGGRYRCDVFLVALQTDRIVKGNGSVKKAQTR